MTLYRDARPWDRADRFVCHTGIETDLIFNKGRDLPGFAAFPLLETPEDRALLRGCYDALAALAHEHGAGAILESPTWMANRDRAAALGYDPGRLAAANRDAIALMAEIRGARGGDGLPLVISGNVGPRGDAYAPKDQMTASEARDYHAEQIEWLAGTEADIVSIYTVAYTAEAAGFARAARDIGMPAVVSFTVETDGRLPDGTPLDRAVAEVDAASEAWCDHFMLNCAHPDHFAGRLPDGAWRVRLRGMVVNASRMSHAELDEAETLDDGDPDELGRQIADLRRAFPALRVIGGCCGTDMRHIARMLAETVEVAA